MNLDPGGTSPAPEAAAGAASDMALGPASEADAGAPAERTAAKLWRAAWEFLHDLSVAVLFCFFLITFVAQAFRVQGTSMEPLLEDGERIVVNKFVYRFRSIDRGDVVVFWYPRDPSVSFIKRVVGLPGDTVEIRSGRLYVNNTVVDESYLPPSFRDSDSVPPTEVRRGYYFVLGDHRRSSNDSRSWGEVPERYIYGRAVFRFWPVARLGPIH
jgi:signal peptidase I